MFQASSLINQGEGPPSGEGQALSGAGAQRKEGVQPPGEQAPTPDICDVLENDWDGFLEHINPAKDTPRYTTTQAQACIQRNSHVSTIANHLQRWLLVCDQ